MESASSMHNQSKSGNLTFRVLPKQIEVLSFSADQIWKRMNSSTIFVMGKFGPTHYQDEPFRLENGSYGWKKGCVRLENAPDTAVILKEVRIQKPGEADEVSNIHFMVAKKIEGEGRYEVKEKEPVYVISLANFNRSFSSISEVEYESSVSRISSKVTYNETPDGTIRNGFGSIIITGSDSSSSESDGESS